MRVHITDDTDQQFLDELQNLLDPRILMTAGKTDSPSDFEILIDGVPDRELIESSPQLKALVIPWAGLPVKTRELMREFPQIGVHNIHHNAAPTAEMAIALMLAAAKKIVPIDRELRHGNWQPRYQTADMVLLAGKTALVLGWGEIGRRVGKSCLALGMKVAGVHRRCYSAEGDVHVYSEDSLKDLLDQSHVLFVCVPLTDQTRGLIDKSSLSLLPDGAIVVNIARGSIVDEAALYNELKSGRLRAAFDVWYNYPKERVDRDETYPSNFALHELDNVVMTPHLAGHTTDTELLRAQALAELLSQAADGSPLPNRVDLDLGY